MSVTDQTPEPCYPPPPPRAPGETWTVYQVDADTYAMRMAPASLARRKRVAGHAAESQARAELEAHPGDARAAALLAEMREQRDIMLAIFEELAPLILEVVEVWPDGSRHHALFPADTDTEAMAPWHALSLEMQLVLLADYKPAEYIVFQPASSALALDRQVIVLGNSPASLEAITQRLGLSPKPSTAPASGSRPSTTGRATPHTTSTNGISPHST